MDDKVITIIVISIVVVGAYLLLTSCKKEDFTNKRHLAVYPKQFSCGDNYSICNPNIETFDNQNIESFDNHSTNHLDTGDRYYHYEENFSCGHNYNICN